MEDGLTFVNTTANPLKITWNETELEANDYTLTPISKTSGNKVDNLQGFDITFTKSFMDKLNEKLNNMTPPATSEITIMYYAQLNKNAVVYGDDSNDNTAYLTYGNNTDDNRTPDSTTETYTFKTSVYKYTDINGSKTALAGAEFSLSLSDDGENHGKIYVVKLPTADGETPVYRVATPEEITVQGANLSDTITTDATGKFEIQGLEGQIYYLHEETAPNGYNKLTAPIKIEIYAEDGKIPNSDTEVKRGETVTNKETTDGTTTTVAPGVVSEVEVLNNTGTILPSTGGIGTTIFYAAGIILMAGAVFFVVRRKKA